MTDDEKTISARILLAVAESAKPPDVLDVPGIHENREFPAVDGWKVAIFYDGSEIDYIAHFVTPTGEKIDFWDWPIDSIDRKILTGWRGVGDMDRLLRDWLEIERHLRADLGLAKGPRR